MDVVIGSHNTPSIVYSLPYTNRNVCTRHTLIEPVHTLDIALNVNTCRADALDIAHRGCRFKGGRRKRSKATAAIHHVSAPIIDFP